MNLENLCLKLAKSDDGDEVIKILKDNNLWNNKGNWHLVGAENIHDQFTNNHSTIGNQQSNPSNALVEKLVNCGDSALMLECKLKNIDPKSQSAPKNVREAAENIFGIEQGRWINSSNDMKRKIAEKYCNLVCTGEKGKNSNPTYTIYDFAEGQHPEDFKTTFMSLSRVNKVEIPFVQGKHGMGSFGAINFCKKEGLQLLISKKHPELSETKDNSWGFTVVRRMYPDDNLNVNDVESTFKSSRWVYLVINEDIPSFKSKGLKILPGDYPETYGKTLTHGTFIKLYNYGIGANLRATATLDLSNKLNQLLVNPIVPVRIYERRKGFKPHSYETTLDGLETRLDRDRSKLLVDGFPAEFIFNSNNQQFIGRIFAYKKYSDEKTKKRTDVKKYGNGVLFTLNGQTNGQLSHRFFSTRGLTYENISKNLLVQIDCSDVSPRYLEELFQNDRERIYQNEFTDDIRSQIVGELKRHPGLKKFQNDWRASEIADYEDDERTNELFNQLLKKNPDIVMYLTGGTRVTNPINRGEHEDTFEPSFFPSFFKTKKKYTIDKPRELEKDRHGRIRLVTDAPNDYFTRYREAGTFKVTFKGEDITNGDGVRLSGYNGNWTLTLPPRSEDIQRYQLIIQDIDKVEPLTCDIFIKLIPNIEHPNKPSKPRQANSINIDPPRVRLIEKDDWEDVEFDDKDVLKIEQQEDDYIFNLNADNLYVLNYLRTLKDSEIELGKKQYELAMSLIGLVILTEYKELENNPDFEKPLGEYSKEYTRVLSPIIMNIIRDISRDL
ncbi:MAG: hypothetical protein ACR2PE_05090 [Porticoccus sp.]